MPTALLAVAFLPPSAVHAQVLDEFTSITDNRHAQQHYESGWALFRSEHWDEAAREFQGAIDAEDTFALAHYSLGRAHMARKRFADAIRAYERCRDLYEQQLQRTAAYQSGARMRDRSASTELLAVTNAMPPFVSLALGSAYFRSGRLLDAERAYKRAIEVDPDCGAAHSNLAALYLVSGRYDEAAAAVKTAERAGYHVNPAMKLEIEKNQKGGAPPSLP